MIQQLGPEPSGEHFRSRDRAVLVVVLGLSAVGAVIGGWWAWIAPPIHAVAALTKAGERVHDYLGNDSDHFFVAPCLMLGLLTVVAVVASVLVWQRREQRGPAMAVALSIGLVAGAAAAVGVGALLVRLRYGALDFAAIPLSSDHKVAYVVEAPPVLFAHGPLQVALTLIWPAGIAALVYAVLAAANARDDLGAFPARRPGRLSGWRNRHYRGPAGVTVDGGEPSYR
jgi:Protein of unknown function (DUF2567)